MLENGNCRLAEIVYQPHGCFNVQQVVVGNVFPVQFAGKAVLIPEKHSALVRVFPVT